MILVKGNLVEEFSNYNNSVLVHGTNDLGVMGKGIALQIKNKWHNVYSEYHARHKEHGLCTGDIIPVSVGHDSFVINAVTQNGYARSYTDTRRYVDYDGLEHAFIKIDKFAKDNNIDSVMFPMIGAGLANGDWDEIKSRILRSKSGDYELVYWEYLP